MYHLSPKLWSDPMFADYVLKQWYKLQDELNEEIRLHGTVNTVKGKILQKKIEELEDWVFCD